MARSYAGDPRAHPGLKGIAGLQVWGTDSIALLQLCDAVPVIQLLRLILASAHVETVPSWRGQEKLKQVRPEVQEVRVRAASRPLALASHQPLLPPLLSTNPVNLKPKSPASCSAQSCRYRSRAHRPLLPWGLAHCSLPGAVKKGHI